MYLNLGKQVADDFPFTYRSSLKIRKIDKATTLTQGKRITSR